MNQESEIKKSYYAIIPADVRYNKNLSANAKLMYGEITALCNEKGYCWATNNYFAELYGACKKSVSNWINELIKEGYIKSDIIYKNGTKEILERRLSIEKNLTTYEKKVNEGNEKNFSRGIEEKVKDNIKEFNNISNNKFNKERESKFIKPTLSEVEEVFFEKTKDTALSKKESVKFYDFYESKGWLVGKVKMKNWRSAVSGWINRMSDFKPVKKEVIQNQTYFMYEPETRPFFDYSKKEG